MSRRDKTQQELLLALHRIERGTPRTVDPKRKLSIAAVAEEAGVHATTIHTRYPDIAEQVRKRTARTGRVQRDVKAQELQAARESNRALRRQLAETEALLRSLASQNATLTMENLQLKAILRAENVRLLPQFKPANQ